ncbi:histidine kinase [Sphingobacterium sp. ML3W]|uniref:histidine kinase n=1 Tax=Sphingobacterium sp. ML3W TaxID=1538644 RepID=UPI00249A017B|nr:histidine kinase [Sphingobacterium sp. ML3W]WFA78155.1 histidine kinase [Sphingobacterium sp. ML3W]
MPARKQFMLTWLKNIVLSAAIVFALAYIFLIIPAAFQDWRDQLTAMGLTSIIYVVVRHLILPRLFIWSRYNAWLLMTFVMLLFLFFCSIPILISLSTGALKWTPEQWNIENFWPVIFLIIPPVLVAFFMYSWQFGVDKWLAYREAQQRLNEIEHISINWELIALTKDLNPHFITNSMATIRALIRKSPANALLAVGILGNIAKVYMNNHDTWFDLRREMEMVDKLVRMYEFIKGHSISLQVENISDGAYRIPKMLLFNLVENALQYGETSIGKYPIQIVITMAEDHRMKLQVSNRIAARAVAGKVSHNTTLERIARQLRLLDPQRAAITVSNDDSIFMLSVSFPQIIDRS